MNTTTAQRLPQLYQSAVAKTPDYFGAVPIPLGAPIGEQPIDDPALYHFLKFVQAFVNANSLLAWGQLYPEAVAENMPANNGDMIFRVHTHDPQEGEFNDTDLPALFAWRTKVDDEHPADDWRTEDVQVTIRWLLPALMGQDKLTTMHPLISALAKMVRVALARGQDPSWVVPGDPDPKAARQGSVLVRWMSASGRWPWLTPWTRVPMFIGEKTYYAYGTILNFTERYAFNSGRQYPRAPNKSGGVYKTPDGGFGDGGVILGSQNLKG